LTTAQTFFIAVGGPSSSSEVQFVAEVTKKIDLIPCKETKTQSTKSIKKVI
jgi:hypothetical protein